MTKINIEKLEEKVEKRLENTSGVKKASATYKYNSDDTSRYVFDVNIEGEIIYLNPHFKLGKINGFSTSNVEEYDLNLSFSIYHRELEDGEQ